MKRLHDWFFGTYYTRGWWIRQDPLIRWFLGAPFIYVAAMVAVWLCLGLPIMLWAGFMSMAEGHSFFSFLNSW